MAAKPTYEQALLHLKVYDLRRESRLRQARDWFFKNYIVDSLADACLCCSCVGNSAADIRAAQGAHPMTHENRVTAVRAEARTHLFVR